MAGDPHLFKDFNNGDEVTPEDIKDCEGGNASGTVRGIAGGIGK